MRDRERTAVAIERLRAAGPRRRRSAAPRPTARRGARRAASSRRDRPGRVSRTSSRVRAASALTTPTGSPARASSVVWSMWISMNPASLVRATPGPGRSRPDRPRPRASRRRATRRRRRGASSTAGRSSRPASALLPNVGVLNRAPSSSANDSTAIGRPPPRRDLERAGHPERPVEAAAAPDAVQVRADPPPRRVGVGTGPQVAGGIALARAARRRRPARSNHAARRRVLLGPGQPVHALGPDADVGRARPAAPASPPS